MVSASAQDVADIVLGIGLPRPGVWREILNTDATDYCGSGRGNCGRVVAESIPMHGQPFSAAMSLPPLATTWFVHGG